MKLTSSRQLMVLLIAALMASLVAVVAQGSPRLQAAADESAPAAGQSIFMPMVKNNSPDVPEDLFDDALAAVAGENGITTEQLTVANVAQATYPLIAAVDYSFKVEDRGTGELYSVTLGADGQAVDSAQRQAAEDAAYRARYGVFEPRLADMLAQGQINAPVKVILWLREPGYTPPVRPSAALTEEEMTALLSANDSQRAAQVAQLTTPIASRLAAMGLEATTDLYAPVVYTTLDPAALRSAGDWAEIDTIYLDHTENEPQLDIARREIGANWVHNSGITGATIALGVIEVGGRAATTNPYLTITQDPTHACATAQSHATAVAGIIRSTHSSLRGISPSSAVRVAGSCSGLTSQLQDRSTAAVNWGASALNLSFGANTNRVVGAMERYYDNLVINRWTTVVAAAGNHGGTGCSQGTSGNILSPALAYNILAVGNYNDRGAVGGADPMHACSSWRDPISTFGDREEPDVAAPGTTITSLSTASPWTNYTGSGTSFSAPMVTGMTALMMNRSRSLSQSPWLGVWPESVRAITMVSAFRNIEGSTRLSERDGAGAVMADRADAIVRRANGGWGAMDYSCATPSTVNLPLGTLSASLRVRAAIAWNNPPSYSGYANRLSADLDLRVIGPGGTTVASSLSFDNPYEIVDFTPSASGAYTLRVTRRTCLASPVGLGWAWYQQPLIAVAAE